MLLSKHPWRRIVYSRVEREREMRVVLLTFACLATLATATLTFDAPSFDLIGCLKTANTYNRSTCTICQQATNTVCSTKDCPPEGGDAEMSDDCSLCYKMTMVSAKIVTRGVYDECKMCGVVVEATNTLAKAKDPAAVEMKATKECSQFCTIESCIRAPEEYGFMQPEALKCLNGVRSACAKLTAAATAT